MLQAVTRKPPCKTCSPAGLQTTLHRPATQPFTTTDPVTNDDRGGTASTTTQPDALRKKCVVVLACFHESYPKRFQVLATPWFCTAYPHTNYPGDSVHILGQPPTHLSIVLLLYCITLPVHFLQHFAVAFCASSLCKHTCARHPEIL